MERYREKEEAKVRQSWEQIRWQTAVLLSPYSKKTLKPTDLILFPWEREESTQIEFALPPNFEKMRMAMDEQARKEGLLKN